MHSYYRGQDCIKMLCKDLEKDVERIIYWEKKEMIPLTDKENKSHENQSVTMYAKKDLLKITKKQEVIVILQENIEELLIASVI